jgi:transposase-like protein
MGTYDRDFIEYPRARATVTTVPSTCPACNSPAISTTAKRPDANSYWRCDACGEVWNARRRQEMRSGPRR